MKDSEEAEEIKSRIEKKIIADAESSGTTSMVGRKF